MKWNWQRKDWRNFRYSKETLAGLENRFLRESGTLFGAFKHLDKPEQQSIKVDLISEEALKTSAIEGEYLDRESLQSSIRKHLGLQTRPKSVPAAERGIAEMMIHLYQNFSTALNDDTLHKWNQLLLSGRIGITDIGRYRTGREPMLIVSGPVHHPEVHFEAPPAASVREEMRLFFEWFNASKEVLPALARAGMAHSWFVSIHPYEDGNGRIGRAISEKAMAQQLGQPTLIALSRQIESNKMAYYAALASINHTNDLTDWLLYFADTVLKAQALTSELVEFAIRKARFFDQWKSTLNPRQEKVISRMFKEGPAGFKGGLSAENYLSITKTSRATATRDLTNLVDKGIFKKTGSLKHTRYFLNLS